MSESGGGRGRQETAPLEWVAAALSALLVLAAAAFLIQGAGGGPRTLPQIAIEVDSIVQAGAGYVVEFRARNDGQITAAGLTVEGEIRSDTGTVETSQVTIDYVPAEGMRRGGLFFTRDPRRGRLEIRPMGYNRP